jgi:hypothetical protein
MKHNGKSPLKLSKPEANIFEKAAYLEKLLGEQHYITTILQCRCSFRIPHPSHRVEGSAARFTLINTGKESSPFARKINADTQIILNVCLIVYIAKQSVY